MQGGTPTQGPRATGLKVKADPAARPQRSKERSRNRVSVGQMTEAW